METKIIFLILALCALVISLIMWLILDRRMDRLSDRLKELNTKLYKVANPAKFQRGDKVRIVTHAVQEQSGKILEEPRITECFGLCWVYKVYCLKTNEVAELREDLLQPLTQ